MAVVPKPSRLRLSSGTLWRCAMSSDLNTSMPSIHISVWHGVCYVYEAWAVGSNGTCHALLLLACHVLAVGWYYSKVPLEDVEEMAKNEPDGTAHRPTTLSCKQKTTED